MVSTFDKPESQSEKIAHGPAWQTLGDFTTTVRVLPISGLAVAIGALAAFVALALLRLIGLFTNLFFPGRLDDLLKARARHLEEERRRERPLKLRFLLPGGRKTEKPQTPVSR
jgi:hypothetical protein